MSSREAALEATVEAAVEATVEAAVEATVEAAVEEALSEETPVDGEALGRKMMKFLRARDPYTASKEETARAFITTSSVLSALVGKHSFIQPLLVEVVKNRLIRLQYVEGHAASITDTDGAAMGKSLAMMLAVNLTATIAVDEWIHQFKSLQEIDSEVSKVETSSS
ncbi:hypothetical protein TrRE_jg1506 [Triparma retinervis]|uniref:Uncharacterized protein n=1 Tax=Triparma retinervis TaxID=2557542 RepID=A0A9W7E6K9_9STRA|nr:hypothetical protein TrRE_jg1506 [Triparma retinervis]